MANSIADAPARATKAPARAKPASAPAPAPADSMTEAHHLVAQVADVINAIIIPASSHWPWGNFPGRENLITADNLLATLAENCGDPVAIEVTGENSIARQLLCIDEQLDEAITQMLAAENHDVGQRYTLLLLASRAGEFIDELSEAYAGLPGTLADLRAMTTYEGLVARREPPPRKPTPPIRRAEPETAIAEYRPYMDEEAATLALRAAATTDLCSWILIAREILAGVTVVADHEPEVLQALLKHDVRFRGAEWDGGDCSTALHYLLQDQHQMIIELGRKGGAA